LNKPISDPITAEVSGREGMLIVVSAPSGAGKTSLCNAVIDFFPDLRHSVSYTTRSMRGGERDGIDYHFVARQIFDDMVARGEFAEWAEVHGNCYGTAAKDLQALLDSGANVVLDIDYQGAAQLKNAFSKGVFIFVLPPDFDELRRRLRHRNTDAPEVIERRIANARREIKEAAWYDYLVVNDDFERACELLESIIRAEGCRTERVSQILKKLVADR